MLCGIDFPKCYGKGEGGDLGGGSLQSPVDIQFPVLKTEFLHKICLKNRPDVGTLVVFDQILVMKLNVLADSCRIYMFLVRLSVALKIMKTLKHIQRNKAVAILLYSVDSEALLVI